MSPTVLDILDADKLRLRELEAENAQLLEDVKRIAAEVREAQGEANRLRRVILMAPHGRGCRELYSSAAPAWMRPGVCNCWKSAALRHNAEEET